MTWSSPPLRVERSVSTQWLADHLGSERLVVLDTSVVELAAADGGEPRLASGYDQYLFDGHIPAALFADLVDPGTDPFALEGVTADHTIVVYDGGDGRFAERSRERLLDRGQEHVAVLDGGLHRWRAEGRTLEDGVSNASVGR